MGKKLFPKEIIQYSAEANFSKHSVKTKLIYLTVLGALVAFFIALPLVRVTVSVRSGGIVKSVTERNQLTSLVSGKIEELFINENSVVERGQVVAKISAPLLQEQADYNLERRQDINGYLSDLSALLNIRAEDFFGSTNNAPSTAVKPVSLTSFEQQIHDGVERVKEAYLQNEQILSISKDEQAELNAARTSLRQLLSDESFSSITSSFSGQQNKYKQALARLHQQVNPLLNQLKEARQIVDRNILLHKRDIVTTSKLNELKSELHNIWENILDILEGEIIHITETESTVQDNTALAFPALLLQTAQYQSAYLRLKQQARNVIQKMELDYQTLKRQQKLYKQNMISKATFQKTKFAVENAKNELKLNIVQQKNKWRVEQVNYQQELQKLKNEFQKIQQKTQKYVIKAPVSGAIQSMKGIYKGGFLAANEPFAVISPDTALVAVCYVPPKDIGLIRKGMDVRFQISTYDYNQWGLLTGKVEEIANDVIVVDNQPVFKVRCSLDRTWLELKNGYRGNLKKGMTLQARFNITERTLFQLLYDNLDDWLNPKWDATQAPAQASASR